LLERWANSGAILGNHTDSHADLNKLTVDEYKKEIIAGEQITLEVMSSHPEYQRYFRHPYTHTGDTETKKERVTDFLEEHGYHIAPYTIDSQDSIFNRIYLDAKMSEDYELKSRIQASYIEFVLATTAFAEQISVKLFGDEIPQTMIFHANSINADTLDEVLERLAQRGYKFIGLENAMEHSAYKIDDTLVTSYGPSWLWRWNKSLDLGISFQGDPEPPDWVLDLYQQSLSSDE